MSWWDTRGLAGNSRLPAPGELPYLVPSHSLPFLGCCQSCFSFWIHLGQILTFHQQGEVSLGLKATMGETGHVGSSLRCWRRGGWQEGDGSVCVCVCVFSLQPCSSFEQVPLSLLRHAELLPVVFTKKRLLQRCWSPMASLCGTKRSCKRRRIFLCSIFLVLFHPQHCLSSLRSLFQRWSWDQGGFQPEGWWPCHLFKGIAVTVALPAQDPHVEKPKPGFQSECAGCESPDLDPGGSTRPKTKVMHWVTCL